MGAGGCLPLVPSLPGTKNKREQKSSVPLNGGPGNLSAQAAVEPPVEENWVCETCLRAFRSKIGLGVHLSQAHKSASNELINITRKNKRWSEEEVFLLATEEVRLRRLNLTLQDNLATAFNRTVESVKGKRREKAYQDLVQELLKEDEITLDDSPLDSTADTPVGQGNPESTVATGYLCTHSQKKGCNCIKNYLGYLQGLHSDSDLDELIGLSIKGQKPLDKLERLLSSLGPGMDNDTAPSSRPKVPRTLSRRKQRQKDYAMFQQLWKSNRSEVARRLLGVEPAGQGPTLRQYEEVWRPILSAVREQPQAEDKHEVPTRVKTHLWSPITIDEVEGFQRSVSGSPGPDGISHEFIRNYPSRRLAKIFNLILLWEVSPSVLLRSRTVFIPKSEGAVADPMAYRPISITSHISRLFHRVLSRRVQASISLNPAQRGFLQADGCAENISLLNACLENARKNRKECHVAILDLQKAFDQVSHQAILEAARSHGLPPQMIRYLRHMYDNSTTILQAHGMSSSNVPLTRGVKQGDPLSPVLFNMVMDTMIGRLPTGVGFKLGQSMVRVLAFADDLVLVTSTRKGLQHLLSSAQSILEPKGLRFNVKKCRSISLVPSGREKKTKVDTEAMFELYDTPLSPTGVEEVLRYLGVEFTPFGKVTRSNCALHELLGKLRKAPLKPQQRLVLLRSYVIPRFYHKLVLGRTNSGELRALDMKVRDAVRQWLRLPHDTPNAYIHAKVIYGGLGIPSFRWDIPRLKIERISRLSTSSGDVFKTLADEPPLRRELEAAKQWANESGLCLDTAARVERMWKEKLHSSVDGRGLVEACKVKSVHSWVNDGTSLLSGNEFIECVKLRINALPTKERTTRGRRHMAMSCRAGCTATESLTHVLQKCHRTHGARIGRHDGVVQILARTLKNRGYRVEREFMYKTGKENLKPDIVCSKGDGTVDVLDAHVVHDSRPLSESRKQKLEKYASNEHLKQAILQRFQASGVRFHTVTISFRGIWEEDSANSMKQLGLSSADLKILTVRTLQGSLNTFRLFNRMTTQATGVKTVASL